MRPVNVCSIEECDPELECATKCRNRFVIVTAAVKIGHSHASEADGRDTWTTSTQFTLLHGITLQKASEAPNPKSQNSNEAPNRKTTKTVDRVDYDFGAWVLKFPGIRNLGFGISDGALRRRSRL